MNEKKRFKGIPLRILLFATAALLSWGLHDVEADMPRSPRQLVVGTSTMAPAASPAVTSRWAKLITAPGIKSASVVKETADGGMVFDGETNSWGAGQRDYWIFKLDSEGSQAWAYTIGDASDNGGASQPTDDGGYIVNGFTSTGITTTPWIMKLDSNAAIAWQKTYNLSVSFGATGLAVSKILTDGYILSGLHMDLGTSSIVFDLVKIDLAGNILWQKSYGATNKMINGGSVSRLTDGSLVVGGMITDMGTEDSDLYLMKLTSTGDLVWAKTYGGPQQEVGGTGVYLTGDGGFFVFGQTKSWGMGGTADGIGDLWGLKLDSSGNIQWQKTYGGAGDDMGLIMPDSAGGYFIGATTTSWGAGGQDIWAAKLDSNGAITWQKTYGGPGDDYGAALPNPSGPGYLISASTDSFGHGAEDEWAAKLDASGNILWQYVYGTSIDEEGATYWTLPSGDFLAEGYTRNPTPPSVTNQDFWAIRADSNGSLGTSCPFIQTGTAVTGTAAGVAGVTTATPVPLTVTVTSPGYTEGAGTLSRTPITLSPTDLCAGAPGCTLSCTATVPGTGTSGNAVNFSSTATPSNCTGEVTYDWDFGDGTAHSSSQNPTHTYASAGTYGWTLTASVNGVDCTKSGSITLSGGGGSNTLAIGTVSGAAGTNSCVNLTLTNSGAPSITALTTDITYDSSKLTPTGVTTTVGGKVVGGNIVSPGTYRVTLYGGTGTVASGTVATVCFDSAAGQCGSFTLGHAPGTPTASDGSANPVAVTGTSGSLTTTGCSGCTLSCTATVPSTGTAGLAVSFSSTATPSNCAGEVTYDWDFGDGTSHAVSQNPSHTYSSAGTYSWALTVSVNGVNCSKSGSITISGGLPSGSPWAWGFNSSGQVGDGTTTDRLSPVSVSGLSNVAAFEGGEAFTLALKSDGTVAAWGNNFFGQLGDGTYSNSLTPVSVSGLTGITSIAAGANHALARRNDGTVWAWGYNTYGQLGNGTVNSNVPIQTTGLSGMTAVGAGANHSVALKSDGTVWAWGYNYYGQLGNGTSGSGTNSNVPGQVSGLSNVTAISAGYYFNLALKGDGTVWAWGYNYNGQLGDGTTTMRTTPIQVGGLTNVTAISAGYAGCLAIKSDGTLWAWGWNGASGETHVPAQIASLTGAVKVAAGYLFAIVLKSDGTAWTWGRNTHGQLGDGSTTWEDNPVQVLSPGFILTIAAGDYHGLAITGTPPCVLSCTATVPGTGTVSAPVSFTATATTTHCPGSPTFAWTFGDGGSSSQQNPAHAYSAAGTYTWGLTVSVNGEVCTQGGTIVISSTPPPLQASSSSDKTSGTAPLAVAFTGAATGGTPPYGYSWTFGDGGTSAQQSPSHTYTQAGSFTAVLSVSDAAAHTAQAAGIAITVAAPLSASASASTTNGNVPLSVSFTGSASGGVAPYGYDWNFGDGTAHSSSQSPSHTYAAAGDYTVTLTVTDSASHSALDNHLVIHATSVPPPIITAMTKMSPFGIKVTGSNLQNGIKVYINGTQWTNVQWKKTIKVKILGGGSLKAVVPKGVATTFRFVNPDGGEATTTWSW
jgi:PKD repeat protein